VVGIYLVINIPGAAAFDDQCNNVFWSAVKANTSDEFDTAMNNMKALRPIAYEYLSKIDPSLWSTFAGSDVFWDEITNNISEQLIGWLSTEVRQMSPVLLLKTILGRLNNEYVKRKELAENRIANNHILTKYAEGLFVKEQSERGMYNCAPQQKANIFHVTRNSKHGKSSSGSNDDHREVIMSNDLKTISYFM
jgi:hypothetical protein